MAENRLTVVRHGETEWSRDGKHTGRTDIPLTDSGRAVAGKLAQALGGQTFALVLTSPLARARDTAALAGFPEAIVDQDLHEWDYGDYEGRTTEEIRETLQHAWFLWDDGVSNGESLVDVAGRADRVIGRVRAVDGDVLAFAHGHFLRVLASRWLDLDPGFGRHLVLSPATLSVLGWERHAPAIEAWNAPVA
ncbi:MAG TPA: histidine phosphatase family protein [Acidimicrobiales bacterium]|nr:histidine phosphatase family protein [Acidimicrobiales bacterium]